jgi:hypothetical protein
MAVKEGRESRLPNMKRGFRAAGFDAKVGEGMQALCPVGKQVVVVDDHSRVKDSS